MVHFGTLSGLSRRDLSDHLKKYGGNKVIVWDEGLTGPLDLIVDNNFLKDHQVVRMFTLKQDRLPGLGNVHVDSIVFISRPEVSNMDKISDNVKGEEMRERGIKTPGSPIVTFFSFRGLPFSANND